MRWKVRAVSSETSDTDPCLVVHFDTAKYFFNCGEGTTRSFATRGERVIHTKAMFFTGLNTDITTGLPGFLMTASDQDLKYLRLVGPPNLTHYIGTARGYCHRATMKLAVTECSPLQTEGVPIFKDNNLTVYAAPVLPENFQASTSVVHGVKRKRHASKTPSVPPSVTAVSTTVHSLDASPDELGETLPSSLLNAKEVLHEASSRSNPTRDESIVTGLSPTLLHSRNVRPRTGTASDVASESASGTHYLPSSEAPSGDNTLFDEAIMATWNVPGFNPTALTGREAELWRRLTVQSMFPGTAVATADDGIGQDVLMNSRVKQDKSAVLQNPCRSPYDLPYTQRLPYAVSYACVGPQFRGKFLADKALELGIPSGPLRGRIANGETVTLKDGRVITPEMCLLPPNPPTAFFVVDCPNTSYIPGLVAATVFHRYRPGNKLVVHCIFHKVGAGVLEDTRYQEWMNSFGEHVQHLISSEMYCIDDVSFTSIAFSQLRLSALDSKVFVVPSFSESPMKSLADLSNLPRNTQALVAGHHVEMNPPGVPAVTHSEGFKDLFHPALLAPTAETESSPVQDIFQRITRDVHASPSTDAQAGDDVTVTTLGTGSALPSKYRNVSATLIQMPERGSVLLDCGENTWGQLRRQFGPHEAENVLRDIRCIFLSHIHGDHHMGVYKLLSKRRQLDPPPSQPMYVITDWSVLGSLREFHNSVENIGLEDPASGIRTIQTEHVVEPDSYAVPSHLEALAEISREKLAELQKELGMTYIRPVSVRHRIKCHGIVMRREDGWSFAYSADTMPCDKLIKAGRDVRLLIHEATFANDQEEAAAEKAHSTYAQAIDVGKRMRAEITLLTHFSQRYSKIMETQPLPLTALESELPEPPQAPEPPFDNILALAFDHVSLRVGDMWKMKHYLDGVLALYGKELEGQDDEVDVPFSTEVTLAKAKTKSKKHIA